MQKVRTAHFRRNKGKPEYGDSYVTKSGSQKEDTEKTEIDLETKGHKEKSKDILLNRKEI